jgi:hypothetical protein
MLRYASEKMADLINAVKGESNLNLIAGNFISELQRYQNISHIHLQIMFAGFFS